ncbi:uncharacterized protein BJX67DRAFT_383085 [Aspergillus lucknowensis]|uniref:Cell wall protein n=1 Tax=Aspergillus lucknowensis TaxID=176173 RepID=A0ABR4LKQ8_9EURO
MRLSSYAPLFLAAVALASASTAPEALPATVAAVDVPASRDVTLIPVHGVSQGDVHLLVRRQLDLDDIVDGIRNLLEPILHLLKPASLQNINLIVTQLASLLNGDGASNTKDLVDSLNSALNSDVFMQLAAQLGPLLPTLTALLDADLIAKLKGILDSASLLLTRDTATQIRDLVDNIAPILPYVGDMIAFFVNLIVGGDGGSSATVTPPTATISQTTDPGKQAPQETETGTDSSDWWDSPGELGSYDHGGEAEPTGTSDSADEDGDSESKSGTETETSPADPGFTGAAGRVSVGVGGVVVGVLVGAVVL